ncbi:MAG: neutral zinc metallopeptidase [Kineosporiaceae bacterium]
MTRTSPAMTRTRPAHRRPAVALAGVVAVLGLVAACTDGTDPDRQLPAAAGEERPAAPIDRGVSRLADRIRDAVAQALGRGPQAPSRSADPDPDATIGTGLRPDFDYATYQRTLQATFATLQEFWTSAVPALGGRYSDPEGGYRPYRSGQGQAPGPRCGGAAAPAGNAFYCSDGDFIAWDETGLVVPYYVGAGDFAASFVLAHEFGHAMQVRLPRQEATGVLRELQADCFAGAWARDVAQKGLLEAGDLDEATLAVFAARDVPGTAWTDPRAHGSGFERTRAFGDGYESGPKACYPAPADSWLISRG